MRSADYFARDALRYQQPGLLRSAGVALLAALVALCPSNAAWSQGNDDGDDGPAKATLTLTLPNIYLDLRTSYSTLPANTLSLGFSHHVLFGTLPPLITLPTVSTPASQSLGVDVPLSLDLNDRISVYGGFSGSASRTDISSWTSFAISSRNFGFQADVYQQNGGLIPTITLQSTITSSVPSSPLSTTSINTIVEMDYALNADETRGLLAGVQYTRVAIDSAQATIKPNVVGYIGSYYQWPNNWKLTGRVGVQSFGGAQLASQTPFQPFTQPIVRVDLDRMDDNDNRLFGVTAEIAWTPKPAYQLTVRTPLYAVRN